METTTDSFVPIESLKGFKEIEKSNWVRFAKHRPNARIRMYCFPFLAGSADMYQSFPDLFPFIEVIPIQLPGRSVRLHEPHVTNMSEFLETVTEQLFPSDKPFILFGYSMGCFLVHELARYIREKVGQSPIALFVNAGAAPHLRKAYLDPNCSEVEFWKHCEAYKFNPVAMKSPEVRRYIEKMVRSDASLRFSKPFYEGPKLPCPIVAFHGERDDWVSREDMEAWSSLSELPLDLTVLPGIDHFWIKNKEWSFRNYVPQLRAKILSFSEEDTPMMDCN